MDNINHLQKLNKIKEDIALDMFLSKDNTFEDLKILNVFFEFVKILLNILGKMNHIMFITTKKGTLLYAIYKKDN